MSGDDRKRKQSIDFKDRRKRDVTEEADVAPHSIQAEKALLGGLLVRPEVIADLPAGLNEGSFYRDAHRRIFRAITRLQERKVAVDMLTVIEELRNTKDLEEVGGAAYISSLADGTPRSTNVEHYAGFVMDHATRRAVIALSHRLIGQAYDGDIQPDALLEAAQKEVLAVTTEMVNEGLVPMSTLVLETYAALERATNGQPMSEGILTGYSELDSLTGGLQRGDLVLLAARPSVGKTALAINIARNAAGAGKKTALFSLEMTKEQLMMRLLSAETRIDSHRLRNGYINDRDHPRLAAALGALNELPLAIDDTAGLPVTDLRARARRAAMEMGGLDLIVVDYLQLLRTRERFENRTQQVSFISSTLKQIAKEMKVPMLALSQLNRTIEHGRERRPQLSDLRESGSLEQDADVVLFIYKPQDADEGPGGAVPAEVIIGKQRNGPAHVEVKMTYFGAYTRFEQQADVPAESAQ